VERLDPNADVLEIWPRVFKQAVFSRSGSARSCRNIAAFIFDLFVMIFARVLFFSRRGPDYPVVRNILPFDAEHRERLMTQTRDLISASVNHKPHPRRHSRGNRRTRLCAREVAGATFWGVAMAFFSLVPVVGSGLIFVPAALWLGFTGHWGRAILILGFARSVRHRGQRFAAAVAGRRSELSGLVVFISVVAASACLNAGLVLGPVLWPRQRGFWRCTWRGGERR